MINKFPHYPQTDEMACGATCLRMIAKHYGKQYTLKELLQSSQTTREGTSLLGIMIITAGLTTHILSNKIQRSGGLSFSYVSFNSFSGSIYSF